MEKTTVRQALDAITTYVEGATGVRYTIGMDQTNDDFISFHKSKAGDNLSWILDVNYTPVDVTPTKLRNPFALVMSNIALVVSIQVDPVTKDDLPRFDEAVDKRFGKGYKASIEHIHGNPYHYEDLLTLEHNGDSDYSLYVDVTFRWEHPGHGRNGKSILMWFRDGHLFKIDNT